MGRDLASARGVCDRTHSYNNAGCKLSIEQTRWATYCLHVNRRRRDIDGRSDFLEHNVTTANRTRACVTPPANARTDPSKPVDKKAAATQTDTNHHTHCWTPKAGVVCWSAVLRAARPRVTPSAPPETHSNLCNMHVPDSIVMSEHPQNSCA